MSVLVGTLSVRVDWGVPRAVAPRFHSTGWETGFMVTRPVGDQDPSQDFPIVIASMPASTQERKSAIRVVILFAIITGTLTPFADVQLARVDAFIPVIQTVMCVADLVTAALLFAQYSVEPRFAILAVASGYITSGLFAFLQTLAFPGGYSPTGVIGDGRDSSAWLFVFWHTCFPLAIMIYALFKDRPPDTSGKSVVTAICVAVALALAAFAGLSWIATAGTAYLPSIYVDGATQQTLTANLLNLFMWLWGLAALAVLFLRRRTVLDLWLMVTLCAWMPNFIAATFMTTFRFSVGWYMARGFALIASCTVLIVLLTETTVLFARLANLIVLLRRERGNRLMSLKAATSAMAHELRQPLTAIGLHSHAAEIHLRKTPANFEQVGESLREIRSAAEQAANVISSVRALFKDTQPRRASVAIDHIAQQALTLANHDLQVNQVSVTAQYDGKLPPVEADSMQLQQVVLNLIKNAIDAMAATPPSSRALRVSTSFGSDSHVLLRVEDTGPGLAANPERIFEPFVTTKTDGMGLGLAISRTIIEAHGGKLRVANTGPQGTTFEVALPLNGAQAYKG
jgi:signal transduction histidine kinase